MGSSVRIAEDDGYAALEREALQGEYLGKEPDLVANAQRLVEQAKRLAAEEQAVASLAATHPGITLDNVVTLTTWPYQQAAAALERAKLAGRVTTRDGRWYPIRP